jgi:transposase
MIPALGDADSRRGFPNRLKFGSTWRTGGGSPWRQRLVFWVTLTRGLFGRRRSIRRTGRKRAGCWLLRRSTTEPRALAAKIGGVGLQVVGDWVLKFNARGPDGLIDRKARGQPPRLNAAHRAASAAILESGPIPAVHGVVRWRIADLCQWIFEEFQVVVAEQTLSRVLRAMGYRKLSARPRHHAQAGGAIEDFKNVWPAPSARGFCRDCRLISLLQRIRPRGTTSGQDGDTRSGPHKILGVERRF